MLRRGQGLRPFPRTPFSASGAVPPLRSGQVFLDEDEHFRHNRVASVATLRQLFAFGPECRSRSLRNQRSPSPESSSASTSSRIVPGSSSVSTPVADCLAFRSSDPIAEFSIGVGALPETESSTAPSAVAFPVRRCARERSRWGSSILREQAKMFQNFLCRTPVPLARLRLLHIQSVHQHCQFLGAHRYAALFFSRRRPPEAPFSSRFAHTHNPLPS